jgi:hypothetical protein
MSLYGGIPWLLPPLEMYYQFSDRIDRALSRSK